MIIFGYKSGPHDCLMDLIHLMRLLIKIQIWCQQLKLNVTEHKRGHAVFLTQNGKCEKWLDWSGNLQSVVSFFSFFWRRSFLLLFFTQPLQPLKFSAGNEQGDALPFCFSSHSANKCAPCHLFVVVFFTFVSFFGHFAV